MQPEIPTVLVEAYVLQARNLPKRNAATLSDTYCLVEATTSPQKYKTLVVPGTLHPVWNESFQVKVRDAASQMITVKMWAQGKDGNDDFVGVVVVPVSRIESGAQKTEEGWYEIRGDKNDVLEGPDGMSKVELSFIFKKAPPGEQQVSGWMTKRSDDAKDWVKRYNQMLNFYESEKAVVEGGPVAGEELCTRACTVDALDVFSDASIAPADRTSQNGFKLSTNFHTLVSQIEVVGQRDTWVEALRKIGNPPGIRFLAAPKQGKVIEAKANSGASAPVRPPPVPAAAAAVKTPEKITQEEPVMKRRDVPAVLGTRASPPAPPAPEVPKEKEASNAVPDNVSPPRVIPEKVQSPAAASQSAASAVSPRAAPAAPGSEAVWQKKFDATRRALADQVGQNQALQARVAELEAGRGGDSGSSAEVQQFKAALQKAQAELERERSRGGGGGEGDAAEIGALLEERTQLRGALALSEEKVALLLQRLQEERVEPNKELSKQLEDAHRSLAEVKQKHLRSEQSRLAAEAELQELRASDMQKNQMDSREEETMLGLKNQVEILTQRLEGMGQQVSAGNGSVGNGGNNSFGGDTNISSIRQRNAKVRALASDITSTLVRRSAKPDISSGNFQVGSQVRNSEYVTSLASARSPRMIDDEDPNLM